MSETIPQPSFIVHLSAAGPDAQPAPLQAEFRFAPETPAVGTPGKNPGDILVLTDAQGVHRLLVSLGKAEKAAPETARRAGGALGKWLVEAPYVTQLDLELGDLAPELVQALGEGLKLGAYRFGRHKHASEAAPEVNVRLRGGAQPESNASIAARVEVITNAVILARDVSHEPANVINPVTLADLACRVAEQHGLTFRVLDENQLAELGAGAILGVGQGSQTPPRLIVLEYAGQDPQAQPVVLVGKAITFDTGGYSIKNVEGIVGMKYDKCGGVDVLATLQAAADLKLKTPLVGIIAAAENMISSQAYRPDDILTSMSGKTIEIISTDAEGRLVLADALAYAQKEYQPRAIIDLATLTGGVIVALGRVRAGLLSNNDPLAEALFQAGEKTFERLWRLPLDEEYRSNMKGDDADLKNSGGREGHCILGGAFLSEFVSEDVPWAHLDIAGVADSKKDQPYAPKGATGFGIRLLLAYLENL